MKANKICPFSLPGLSKMDNINYFNFFCSCNIMESQCYIMVKQLFNFQINRSDSENYFYTCAREHAFNF